MKARRPASVGPARLARNVEIVVLDADGVLTDGGLYYGPNGEAFKRFDVRDGHGIVLGRLSGLRTAILTGRTSEAVASRARELRIGPVIQGAKNKVEGLRVLLEKAGLPAERAAYMGDDVNDLGPLGLVALAACPADAAPEVRKVCHLVTRSAGGRGAVRELFEFVLKAQGKWDQAVTAVRAPR